AQPPPPRLRVPQKPRNPLTSREREVAALIARGLSNREIATKPTIAERTAISHVEHNMNKLGLHSRAQIAAWAVRHGLDVPTESLSPPRIRTSSENPAAVRVRTIGFAFR